MRSNDVSRKPPETITWAIRVLALGVCALTAMTVIAFIVLWNKVESIDEQLIHTPPVVVVDFVRLVDSYGADLGPAALEKRMLQTGQKIEMLRQSGYLVLDAANIIAAPESLNIPFDVLNED